MKKIIFSVCCTVFLLCLSEQIACACTCLEVENKKVSYKQWLKKFNGAVFSGRVNKTEELPGYDLKVTFEVERYWKGITNTETIVYTEATSCGFHYVEGERYFVVAGNSKNGKLRTYVCLELEYSQSEERLVKELGEGKKLKTNANDL